MRTSTTLMVYASDTNAVMQPVFSQATTAAPSACVRVKAAIDAAPSVLEKAQSITTSRWSPVVGPVSTRVALSAHNASASQAYRAALGAGAAVSGASSDRSPSHTLPIIIGGSCVAGVFLLAGVLLAVRYYFDKAARNTVLRAANGEN